jgi:hypothetical protein
MVHTPARKTAVNVSSFQLEALEGRRMLSATPGGPAGSSLLRFSQTTVEAEWDYYDSTGTILTQMQVSAATQTTTVGGSAPSTAPLVAVLIIQTDMANVATLQFSQGYATSSDIQLLDIDSNLKSAHVIATVQMQDQYNQRLYSLALDMTWSANGATSTASTVEPGYSEDVVTTREMNASGTAIGNGVDYAQGPAIESEAIREHDGLTHFSAATDLFNTDAPILA